MKKKIHLLLNVGLKLIRTLFKIKVFWILKNSIDFFSLTLVIFSKIKMKKRSKFFPSQTIPYIPFCYTFVYFDPVKCQVDSKEKK